MNISTFLYKFSQSSKCLTRRKVRIAFFCGRKVTSRCMIKVDTEVRHAQALSHKTDMPPLYAEVNTGTHFRILQYYYCESK